MFVTPLMSPKEGYAMYCPTLDKVAFGTLRGAVQAMIRTHDRIGVWQRPYRCEPGCGDYHLTTNDFSGQPVSDDQAAQIIKIYG